jgi:hypothetical protein
MKVSLVEVEKPKRGKRGKKMKEEMITDPLGDSSISTITPSGDKKDKLNVTDNVKQYAPEGGQMTFDIEKDKATELRIALDKAIEKDAYQEQAAAIESSQNPIPKELQAPYLNGTYDEAVLESALNRILQKNKMYEKEKYMELKKKSLEKIAKLLGVDSNIDTDTIGAGTGEMAGNSTVMGDNMQTETKPIMSESSSTAVGGEAPIPKPSAPKPKPKEEYYGEIPASSGIEKYRDAFGFGSFF